MASSGYSGTPLAKKLGIKQGAAVLVLNTPKPYLEFFHEFPADVQLMDSGDKQQMADFIHIFVSKESDLKLYFKNAKSRLKKDGVLWLSWPKKSSGIATELDKTAIRNFGLNNGLVDTKVAAVDSDWSGHKFVYRLTDR